MVDTIETDVKSPFALHEGDRPARWIYDNWVQAAATRGTAFTNAYLARAGERAEMSFGTAVPPFPDIPSETRTVTAYVNSGRWMWQCCICPSAQVCTPNDPYAYCIECFNAGDGPFPIVFPANITAIEAALDARPNRLNQNWSPDETVEDLLAENEEHGI